MPQYESICSCAALHICCTPSSQLRFLQNYRNIWWHLYQIYMTSKSQTFTVITKLIRSSIWHVYIYSRYIPAFYILLVTWLLVDFFPIQICEQITVLSVETFLTVHPWYFWTVVTQTAVAVNGLLVFPPAAFPLTSAGCEAIWDRL